MNPTVMQHAHRVRERAGCAVPKARSPICLGQPTGRHGARHERCRRASSREARFLRSIQRHARPGVWPQTGRRSRLRRSASFTVLLPAFMLRDCGIRIPDHRTAYDHGIAQSGRGLPQSKTLPCSATPLARSARSWTAAVLCRFVVEPRGAR